MITVYVIALLCNSAPNHATVIGYYDTYKAAIAAFKQRKFYIKLGCTMQLETYEIEDTEE